MRDLIHTELAEHRGSPHTRNGYTAGSDCIGSWSKLGDIQAGTYNPGVDPVFGMIAVPVGPAVVSRVAGVPN